MIEGAIKDRQSVTSDWQVLRDLIAGVEVREVKNVITRNGVTTEIFRQDWLVGRTIQHMIHATLRPRTISAWHYHELQLDHIFVIEGTIKLVLYDDRENSPTHGRVNVFHLSLLRPTLVVFPPEIWHGFQNLSNATSHFINFFDRPYCYNDPDEWLLPYDSPKIPYKFLD